MTSWGLRGASLGSLFALVENLWTVLSGHGIPFGYVVAVIVLYSLVGAIIGLALGGVILLMKRPFPEQGSSAVWLVSGMTYVWSADKVIEAANFRSYPVLPALFVSLLVFVGGTALLWRWIRGRWRSRQPEVSLALTGFIVAGWLVCGRQLAKELFGALTTSGGLIFFAAGSIGVLAILVALERMLARARWEPQISVPRVFTTALSLSLGVTLLVWVRGNGDSTIPHMEPRRSVVEPGNGPNVVLITLDTLRADRLSLYGYGVQTSPNLDAFAREGVLFENAIAPASWTLPSHASMFTGLFPHRHGAHFVDDPVGEAEERFSARGLTESHVTLAEILSAEGYETAGFVSNYASLSTGLGTHQGFEVYDDRPRRIWDFKPTMNSLVEQLPYLRDCLSKPYRSAGELNEVVFEWLDSRSEPSRPLFLFINYMDTHAPFCPPNGSNHFFWQRTSANPEHDVMAGDGLSARDEKHFRAAYDSEIEFADAHLGELFQKLEEHSLYDDALVIVTSDHGEYFGEHALWGHAYGPYDPVYRVPLAVKFPVGIRTGDGGPKTRGTVSSYVRTFDIFTTVLETVDIAVPHGLDAISLFAPGEDERRIIVEQYGSAYFSRLYGEKFDRAYTGIYDFPWKYVSFSDGEAHLYNLSADPGETRNLADDYPSVRARLEKALSTWREENEPFRNDGSSQITDPELLERLRSLGYVE